MARHPGGPGGGGGRTPWLALLLLATFPGCFGPLTLTDLVSTRSYASETDVSASARKNFGQARARHNKQPLEAEAAWQFGRACFEVAEFATNDLERAAIANEGIAVCRQVVAREPSLAQGHYYLGMNLGQLARTRSLGALKLVGQMQREFSAASELDERFDYSGADRHLGVLYRDAPALGSIGSRSKARQHLQRAVELAPEFPENRLNLIEAFLKWGSRNEARRELKLLEGAWEQARATFSDDAWAASWADWDQRRKALRKKFEEPSGALESPRSRQ